MIIDLIIKNFLFFFSYKHLVFENFLFFYCLNNLLDINFNTVRLLLLLLLLK